MRDSYRQAYGLIPLLNMLEANGIDVADFLSSVDIPGFGITDPAYTIRGADPCHRIEFARRAKRGAKACTVHPP